MEALWDDKRLLEALRLAGGEELALSREEGMSRASKTRILSAILALASLWEIRMVPLSLKILAKFSYIWLSLAAVIGLYGLALACGPVLEVFFRASSKRARVLGKNKKPPQILTAAQHRTLAPAK